MLDVKPCACELRCLRGPTRGGDPIPALRLPPLQDPGQLSHDGRAGVVGFVGRTRPQDMFVLRGEHRPSGRATHNRPCLGSQCS